MTQDKLDSIDNIFFTALSFHHYANTAYPLTPRSLSQYEVNDYTEQYDLVKSNITAQKKLCLYVHVPFCAHRCKFCEYVVLNTATDEDKKVYVEHLLKEISMYKDIVRDTEIVGYDLGGGTPTCLSCDDIAKITEKIREFNIKPGTSFSIETTPVIAANDIDKLKFIRSLGYDRISMGFQTVNTKLLSLLERDGSEHIYNKAVENIREAGFKRLNIDLMYGFAAQNNEDFRSTVKFAISKNPEYITLYRNRYKGTKLESDCGAVSLHKANMQYDIAYHELCAAGYEANEGKNTFSKVKNDLGTSDYLTERVINATSYVGIGLGAQSFVGNYLAYNLGCDSHKLDRYVEAIDAGRLPINDIAKLPLDEAIAKALSVMFYFGFISEKAYEKRFGEKFSNRFGDEIEYLQTNNIMHYDPLDNDKFILTPYGVSRMSGAIALFYSARSQKEMLNLIAKKVDTHKYDDTFLKYYKQEEFDRPSIATDIVVLSEDCRKVLLISRAENPYVGKLAFPGGFYKKSDESILACAERELKEETDLTINDMKFCFIADAKDRDPRGWIVSVVYATKVKTQDVLPHGDSDALYAKWYDINSLTSDMLAFDHWKTLQQVVTNLKSN